MTLNHRIAVIGGGVMGLSLAWELSVRGHAVTLMESGKLARKASWAGAGILAPANAQTMTQPLDKLMGLGSDLHREWTLMLKEETGVDNGYHDCGGLYVARTHGERAALQGQLLNWDQYEIGYRKLNSRHEHEHAVRLNVDDDDLMVWVPNESQICNPDHLRALVCACQRRGVTMIEDCDLDFGLRGGAIVDAAGAKSWDAICFCTGAWTSRLMESIGIEVPLIPVRGQMLLFKLESPLFEPIINEGSRYIVPRRDGHVLVGSTTEEVGFDESTTEEKIAELIRFSTSLVPELNESSLVKSWAGLRPASHDGFPFMGRLPGTENGFMATGHFKAGLQMSPAVAVIMADLMQDEDTLMDLGPFNPGRLDLSNYLR